MPVKIDQQVQEANVLHGKALKYAAELTAVGVTAEEIASLETARDDLITKDTQQREKANDLREKTTLQNNAIKNARVVIRKIRDVAKLVYRSDDTARSGFHIGNRMPSSVSEMLTELAYLKKLATRRISDLQTRGLSQADIDALDTHKAAIEEADQVQEMAKREKVSATQIRDESLRALKDIMFNIRKSAKICFADNPTVLQEFRQID